MTYLWKGTIMGIRLRHVVTALAVAALAAAPLAAQALTIDGTKTHLKAVGPVSGDHGFPTWYEDQTGQRLEPCLDPLDLYCGIVPATMPDPAQPVSFPDNFPDELFYMAAGSGLTLPNGGTATLTLALEGAFANGPVVPGDQLVFARIRIKITDVAPGATYTIHHPYGTDTHTADGGGRFFFTEDIGIAPGVFTGALAGRIGPFLKWDVGAPAGYLGDPAVLHAVTGSPVTDDAGSAQNYFRITGADGTDVRTDQFSLLGKYSTNSGVTGSAATYARTTTDGGFLDVYATSDAGSSIELKADAAAGYGTTVLRGDGSGRYFARVAFTGAVPGSVTVLNAGDVPPASKTIPVTDVVRVTAADYDADAQSLHVAATSSDTAAAPTLTVAGIGDLVGGTADFTGVGAVPAVVQVTSSAGGSGGMAVAAAGAAFPFLPVQAYAGADQSVAQGATVTLDASASTGDPTGFSWTQVAGPAVTLQGAGTSRATFVAPAESATLTFEVTVQGPGGPSTDSVDVTVTDVLPPVASAGPDQTVRRGTLVRLDAAATTGATTYAWTRVDDQLGDPAIILSGADTATPSFTFPLMVTPDSNRPITLQLTATGPGGTATDTVVVTPQPETLVVTSAAFRSGKNEWRIDGTSSIPAGQRITVHLGSELTGPVIGTALVDATGAFRLRLSNVPAPARPPANVTSTRISVESTLGGTLSGATAFNATVGR